jgi:hypothetical protein
MKTTTQKEVKGTQGVNASQAKAAATATNAKPVNGSAVPATKTEAVIPLHKPAGKPLTIEEQMKHFDGLAQLVTMKRRVEKHKEIVQELQVSDEELAKFETDKRTTASIILCDDEGNEYEISNPVLVREVQIYVTHSLDRKIAEYDNKIMSYGN